MNKENMNKDENNKKNKIKEFIMYFIMIIIIILIILLLLKHCELSKANRKKDIIPEITTTEKTTTTETTTTELITETTTTIPTSAPVTVKTTRTTTVKPNYEVPTTTRITTTRTNSTTKATTTTTTTTTKKVDKYTYVYNIETSETKSFNIFKNGVVLEEYILVLDNNGTPVTFGRSGKEKFLTMINSNIDLSKCPTITFQICNPQGGNCGEKLKAGC